MRAGAPHTRRRKSVDDKRRGNGEPDLEILGSTGQR